MRDKLARELARSVISTHYDEFKISAMHPKLSEPKNKMKNGVIVETTTHVDLEVVYHKTNVHKSVSNQNNKLVQVTTKPQNDKVQLIKIDYVKPFQLNMVFLGPIIQLLYIELPMYDPLWKVLVAMTKYIDELGFPNRIKFSISRFYTIEITKESYIEDCNKIKDISFEIPE